MHRSLRFRMVWLKVRLEIYAIGICNSKSSFEKIPGCGFKVADDRWRVVVDVDALMSLGT